MKPTQKTLQLSPARLLAGLGLCLALMNLTTHADDLEVITVSATPVSLSEAGSSVSIITADDILLKNAASLQELLREVPGFAVSQTGGHGAVTQVRVRGAEGNQLLVLIDGIEANDIAQGGGFDFSSLLTTGIERIEIVRGPQSALWGSDAMAGVVHIITRPAASPSTRSPATDPGIKSATGDSTKTATGVAETGSFGTVRGSFSASHQAAGRRTRLSVESMATDGTNISRTGTEADGFKNTTASLAGDYQLADALGLSFTARHTDTTTAIDATGAAGLPVDADIETNSTRQYLGGNITYNGSDTITHRLSLARASSDNRDQGQDASTNRTRGAKNTARYQLNLASAAQRLSVLAEHETEAFRQRGDASPLGDPNQNREVKTTSLALEYRYDGARVNLSASVRRDDNSDFKDADSWRLTGNWPLGASILFASVGESVKNPTFTERFGYFTNFLGNPNLAPETSFGWEAGVKHAWLEGRLSTGLTWFNADLDKEINGFVYVPELGEFTAENSTGESTRRGLELEAAWSPIESLELAASYTWLDATQEDATGQDVTEVRRPEHSGAFTATYQGHKAAIHLAISHAGTQEDDFFPPDLPQQRVVLDSFTLASLSGQYPLTPRLTLTGRL